MKGIVHSPESIEKMRQTKMGHEVSIQTKMKIGMKNKGKKWYNNGKINKFCHECPGKGWINGRLPFR